MDWNDKSNTKRVKIWNTQFCKDAEELRFETMTGRFFKGEHLYPWDIDPEETSILRSVKSKGRAKYLFPTDFDAEQVDEALVATAKLYVMGIKNYFGVRCMIKETGNTGLHVYGFVEFPMYWKDEKCRDYMKGMAATSWSLMALDELGVGFGKNLEKPYIDTCMYDAGRMVRAFSKHPKSGRYPELIYNADNIYDIHYQRPATRPLITVDERGGSSGVSASTAYLNNIKVGAPKSTFKWMPKKLKRLVGFKGDPPHEHKWGLILWLRKNTDYTPEQIAKWIWDNCEWDDLTNWSTTLYHTKWTCKWSDKMYERDGRRPNPKWIYA
jgi:hypothetical protein